MKLALRFFTVLLAVLLLAPTTAFATASPGDTSANILNTAGEQAVDNSYSHQIYQAPATRSSAFRIVLLDQTIYRSGRQLTAELAVMLSEQAHSVFVDTYFQKYESTTGKWVTVYSSMKSKMNCSSYTASTSYTVSTAGRYRVFQEVSAYSQSFVEEYKYITSSYFDIT